MKKDSSGFILHPSSFRRGDATMTMTIFAVIGFAELIPLAVFAGLVALVFAVLSMISNRNSRAAERLERISRPASLAEIEDPSKAKKERFQGVMETAKALSA